MLDARLASFAASRGSAAAGFVWGAAEASVFFIIPDPLVALVGLFAPRRSPAVFAAILAGAAVGGAALYLASDAVPGEIAALLGSLPGLTPADVETAARELAREGPLAFVNAPLAGQPVKLYAHAAAAQGYGLPAVVALVVVNRFVRVGLTALASALVGARFGAWIERRRRPLATLFVAFWLVAYPVYFALRAG